MKYLFVNLLPITCVLGAVYLIVKEKDGWGWLILIAILSSHTFNDRKN